MRALFLTVLGLAILPASDWTRFRGPNGSGVSSDTNLPSEISRDRNVAWKIQTPKGNSSPIVTGGKLLITGHEGDERIVLCYDAATGAALWRKSVIKAFTETPNPLNGLTTPTPVTDGHSVFVFFPDFGLIAYDLDGKELWRVKLGPFGGVQGMAVSPILAEGNVVLLIDTPEQAHLVAFSTATGKQVWKTERPVGFLGSYATPSVYQPGKGPLEIVVAGAVELTGYQAKTGERIWWVRGLTYAPATLPLVVGDAVYTMEPVPEAGSAPPFSGMLAQYDKNKDGKIQLSEVTGDSVTEKIHRRIFKSVDKNSGDNDGAVTAEEWERAFSPGEASGGLVRTRLGGKGDVSKTNVGWRHAKGLPYTIAPLVYRDLLYTIRNGGIVSVFDPESGKLLREERLKNAIGDYYAQPVAAGGKIYFANKDGKTSVISAGAGWQLLSSGDLDEQVIATPAIAIGRIYLRANGTLYCFATASK